MLQMAANAYPKIAKDRELEECCREITGNYWPLALGAFWSKVMELPRHPFLGAIEDTPSLKLSTPGALQGCQYHVS